MPLKTIPFDVVDLLKTAEDIELFLEAAAEESDEAYQQRALQIVAEARARWNIPASE